MSLNYKITLYIFLTACIITGCSRKQNFYHGYVYDLQTKKPLENVDVKENLVKDPLTGRTDKTGYFKIENTTGSIADLIFSGKDYKQDTLPTVWSQHGERLEYSFVNKNPDTIYLRKK